MSPRGDSPEPNCTEYEYPATVPAGHPENRTGPSLRRGITARQGPPLRSLERSWYEEILETQQKRIEKMEGLVPGFPVLR